MKLKQRFLRKETIPLPVLFYNTEEVAKVLKVSKWTIHKWVKAGIIKPIKSACRAGKKRKHCRSYFLNSDILKLVDHRFPFLLPYQRQEIKLRLLKGRK